MATTITERHAEAANKVADEWVDGLTDTAEIADVRADIIDKYLAMYVQEDLREAVAAEIGEVSLC